MYGELETGAKTRMSKSTVPCTLFLASLLKEWRTESACASDGDFVFAPRTLMGRKPRRGSVVVTHHLKLTAVRAGVIEVKDRKSYMGGELVKRFGFHTFRHSLTVVANGQRPESADRSCDAPVDEP